MSENLKLIRYFASEFYENKVMDLAHFVSPSFYYCVNSGMKKTFETYVLRMQIMFKNSVSIMSEPRTTDDHTFYIDYVIILKNSEKDDKLYGTVKYYVQNGLLQNIHVQHHNEQKANK